ncbi:hypothetical protein [Mesoterricola silvestris]|uniref:hypothetical protein n=1 Tax=Mesoterricola silvestris TaxID=2927979 RepID=UPI00292EFF06|nr:hypothetical protein [Mesoterricola silvestris]
MRWGAALSQTDKKGEADKGLPVKATAKGTTVTYEYKDGSTTKVKGTHPNRDNNPGNLVNGKVAKEHGAIGTDGKFAIFPSAQHGWEALADLLDNKYANSSLNGTIDSYAPPSENNTAQYKADLSRLTGVSGDTVLSTLDKGQKATLANTIGRIEGWKGVPYVPPE